MRPQVYKVMCLGLTVIKMGIMPQRVTGRCDERMQVESLEQYLRCREGSVIIS